MVTGPLYDDLAVLQACRAYEAAAGPTWPSPALTSALLKAEGNADAAVKAKIRPSAENAGAVSPIAVSAGGPVSRRFSPVSTEIKNRAKTFGSVITGQTIHFESGVQAR